MIRLPLRISLAAEIAANSIRFSRSDVMTDVSSLHAYPSFISPIVSLDWRR